MGRPKGSRNRTNFYHKALDALGKSEIESAGFAGVDDEIVLLRLLLRWISENEPHNYDTVLQIVDRLAGLIRLRALLSGNGRKPVTVKDIQKLMQGYTLPLGISTLPRPPL